MSLRTAKMRYLQIKIANAVCPRIDQSSLELVNTAVSMWRNYGQRCFRSQAQWPAQDCSRSLRENVFQLELRMTTNNELFTQWNEDKTTGIGWRGHFTDETIGYANFALSTDLSTSVTVICKTRNCFSYLPLISIWFLSPCFQRQKLFTSSRNHRNEIIKGLLWTVCFALQGFHGSQQWNSFAWK